MFSFIYHSKKKYVVSFSYSQNENLKAIVFKFKKSAVAKVHSKIKKPPPVALGW
jgi:hypothetical protein